MLSDTERRVGPSYGAARPGEDPATSRPARVTTLIAPDGTVARTYAVSDIAGHPGELLAALDELAPGRRS